MCLCRYKDGVPIKKDSICYKMSAFSLTITDVQLKHAGVFTIRLCNQGKGLCKNLTYTVVVTGKLVAIKLKMTADTEERKQCFSHELRPPQYSGCLQCSSLDGR